MKKQLAILLVIFCVLGMAGCNNQSQKLQGDQLLAEGNVVKINISSLPERYNYCFNGKDTKAIMDYLSALNLDNKFVENPDAYGGMTWVIALEYENGDILKIYHLGNMFIRSEKGSWYKITYEETNSLDALLNELNN